MELVLVVTAAAVMAGVLLLQVLLLRRLYVRPTQGQALIINKAQGEPVVTFTGGLVLPIVQRAELLDLTVRRIRVELEGEEGLPCKGLERVDIAAVFSVCIARDPEPVLRVARSVGCTTANDPGRVEELLTLKLVLAMREACQTFSAAGLPARTLELRDAVLERLRPDINGFTVEDMEIDWVRRQGAPLRGGPRPAERSAP